MANNGNRIGELSLKNNLNTRIRTGAGWIAIIIGVLAVYGYSIYDFLIDTSESLWIRLGLLVIGLGILILFLQVLRQQLIARKSERYKDVEN